jgi:hypothetical protein
MRSKIPSVCVARPLIVNHLSSPAVLKKKCVIPDLGFCARYISLIILLFCYKSSKFKEALRQLSFLFKPQNRDGQHLRLLFNNNLDVLTFISACSLPVGCFADTDDVTIKPRP